VHVVNACAAAAEEHNQYADVVADVVASPVEGAAAVVVVVVVAALPLVRFVEQGDHLALRAANFRQEYPLGSRH